MKPGGAPATEHKIVLYYDILKAIVFFAKDEKNRTRRGKSFISIFFQYLREKNMDEMSPNIKRCFERRLFTPGEEWWASDGFDSTYVTLLASGCVSWISPTNYWDVDPILGEKLDIFDKEELMWLEKMGVLYRNHYPIGNGKYVSGR